MEVDVVSLAAEFPNDNPALHRGVSWVCLDVTGACVPIAHPAPPVVVETITHAEQDEVAASLSVEELITALDLDMPVPDVAPEIPAARISGIVGLGDTPRDDSEPEIVAAHDDDEEPILVEDLPPLDETATLEGLEPPLEPVVEPAMELEPAAELVPATTIAPPPSDDPWVILVSALADVAIAAGSPHVASLLPGLLLDGRLEAVPDDAAQALAEANVFRDREVTPAFVAQTRAWRGILLGTSDDFEACGNAMLDEWAADLVARLLGAPSRAASLKRELRTRGVAAFGLVEAA